MNRTTPSPGSAFSRDSKRILMLSIVNPAVERNGASTVTRGLIKLLTAPPLQAQVECLPVRVEPVRWHWLAQARSLVRSSLSKLPAKPAFLYSKRFRQEVLARLRRQHYDLIVLNGADLLWISEYLPQSIPRILVAHNIEHQLFDTQIQNIRGLSWPLEAWFRAECARLKNYEVSGMRETGNVIFLSHEDATLAQRLSGGLHSTTIPPVFDYEPAIREPRKAGPTLEIGLLGYFRWWPNRLGLRWFAQEVLPHVKAPLHLNLFGTPAGHRHNDPRITAHGAIERIQDVWAPCDFMICPAFSTGGVCVKLAEAAYNRIPALATTHAARGLPIDADPALVFVDEPGEWIEFLNSNAARLLAERRVSESTSARFAMEAQRNPLQGFVDDVICSGARRAAASNQDEADGLRTYCL